MLEKGKVIPKTAHNYKDGKCTVCGKADPNYKADAGSPQTGDSGSPQTGDGGNIQIWIALLLISGAGVISFAAYGRKRKYRR